VPSGLWRGSRPACWRTPELVVGPVTDSDGNDGYRHAGLTAPGWRLSGTVLRRFCGSRDSRGDNGAGTDPPFTTSWPTVFPIATGVILLAVGQTLPETGVPDGSHLDSQVSTIHHNPPELTDYTDQRDQLSNGSMRTGIAGTELRHQTWTTPGIVPPAFHARPGHQIIPIGGSLQRRGRHGKMPGLPGGSRRTARPTRKKENRSRTSPGGGVAAQVINAVMGPGRGANRADLGRSDGTAGTTTTCHASAR